MHSSVSRVSSMRCGLLLGFATLVLAGVLAAPPPAGAAHLWAQSWDPRPGYDVFGVSVAAAPGGDVYAAATPCSTSHEPCGIAVARYTENGTRLWGKLPIVAQGSGLAGIASDPGGNLVIAGYAPSGGGGSEWWIAKLSPKGATLWVRRLAGVRGTANEARAVLTDPSGNIFVCGTLVRSGALPDAALVRLEPVRGRVLWQQLIDGGVNRYDQATALARDPSGRIYMTGSLFSGGTLDDVFVAAFTPGGRRVWTQTWNNPQADENDYAFDIAASRTTVAVVGSTPGAWDAVYDTWDRDGLILAYSSAGRSRWQYTEHGMAPWGDFCAAHADDAGNVAAAGSLVNGTTADYKAMLVMLSPAGIVHHSVSLPNGAFRGSFAAMASDGSSLVAVGSTATVLGATDALLCTVTPGLQNWMSTFAGGPGTSVVGSDVLCQDGGIYVGAAVGNRLGLVRF